MGAIIVIYVALIVLMIVSMWKIFTKAGKPGWACIVPFYNIFVLIEIVGKPWWWLLLIIFVPFVNIILAIWLVNLLSKSFGHGVGFTLGLLFLSFVFIPILGLGESKYVGPAGKAQTQPEAPAASPAS